MSRIALLIPCMFLVSLAFGESTPPPSGEKHDNKTLQAFAEQTNQFGFDLFQHLRQQPGNLFVSPYSISSALAMTAAGARGQTAEQMVKMLGLPPEVSKYAGLEQGLMASLLDNPKGYDIRIANALWGQSQHPFKADYIQLLQRSFRAEARNLDFVKQTEASRAAINAWVQMQTNNRIQNLLPSGSITPLTRLVLTNAIYFKGNWDKQFDKKLTRTENFYTSADQPTKAQMMHRLAYMNYFSSNDLHCVELPYAGNRLSMFILLPKKKHGLAEVEAGLTASSLTKLLNDYGFAKVNLTMPKFKMTYSASLRQTLPQLGMIDAFNTDKADFSGMDGTKEGSITEVLHKAFCEVNEEGTEAAAATAVVKSAPGAVSAPQSPIEFTADHPFLFLIRDTQTGSILFLGRVTNPL